MGDRLQAGKPSRCVTKPLRSTQPGHPSVGRRNEYKQKRQSAVSSEGTLGHTHVMYVIRRGTHKYKYADKFLA